MGFSVITTIEIKASSYDLTVTATAKDELAIPSTDTSKDSFIGRAITEASSMISNFCNRTFVSEQVRDDFYWDRSAPTYQTPRGPRPLQLSRWPVLKVISVIQTLEEGVTQTLTAGVDFYVNYENGELLRMRSDDGLATDNVQINWETFPVSVRYSAGYGVLVPNEAHNIPANPYQVTVTNAASFGIDQGVTYAVGGAALTLIASGTPAAGQYTVTSAGLYTFAAADTGKGVLINYITDAIPSDLELATLRMVSVRFAQRGGRDPMLVSISQPAVGEKRWWVGSTPGQKGSLPPEVASLLEGTYRVPVVS